MPSPPLDHEAATDFAHELVHLALTAPDDPTCLHQLGAMDERQVLLIVASLRGIAAGAFIAVCDGDRDAAVDLVRTTRDRHEASR